MPRFARYVKTGLHLTLSSSGEKGWRLRATQDMIKPRWQTAPFTMQMHERKTRNAGQVKPETGNLPDPSGSTQNAKPTPLKSETPHEFGVQLV